MASNENVMLGDRLWAAFDNSPPTKRKDDDLSDGIFTGREHHKVIFDCKEGELDDGEARIGVCGDPRPSTLYVDDQRGDVYVQNRGAYDRVATGLATRSTPERRETLWENVQDKYEDEDKTGIFESDDGYGYVGLGAAGMAEADVERLILGLVKPYASYLPTSHHNSYYRGDAWKANGDFYSIVYDLTAHGVNAKPS